MRWIAVFILLYCIAGNFINGRNMKVGLLLEVDNCCSFQSFENSVGAISIALDALRTDRIWSENISFVWSNTVQINDGVGNVVDLVRDQNVDLILGSPSSIPTIPAAHLTSKWNFPHISWAASSYELSDKQVYRTFIRTRGSISDWGYFIRTLFEKEGWQQVGMLYQDYRLCKYCADGLLDVIATSNLTLTLGIQMTETELPDNTIDRNFARMKKTSRIIYLCVELDQLRHYLVRACVLGMCNGEYLFIFPQYNPIKDDIVNMQDGLDGLARKGFRHLLLVTLAAWNGVGGKVKYDNFQREVIERMTEAPWYNNDAQLANQMASDVAPALYNAMYFYGLWLNHTSTHGLDPRNGTGMMDFSKGLSFEGKTGKVLFKDTGDLLPAVWVWQFLGSNGTPEIVLDSGYSADIDIDLQWETNDGKPPTDQPVCGFYNEFCPASVLQEGNSYVTYIVTPMTLLCLAAFGTLGALILRKRKLDQMVKITWKIDPKLVLRIDARKGLTSEGNLRSQFSLTSTKTTLRSETSPVGHMQSEVRTALYNGNIVFIKPLLNSVVLHKSDMKELEKMKEMIHMNINPFFGACFDPPSPMALFQYCPKGSLQDIIENTDITLDKTLIHSLIYDLVQGIKYIHDTSMESHGCLKSSNCVIDARWTLKLTDYGLGKYAVDFYERDQNEAEKYKSMLWTAPEILKEPHLFTKGSQKGDIYSLGIILHEVIFRMGVFAGWEEMTAEEIIQHVKNSEVTPMRPKLFSKTSVDSSELLEVMRACWSEMPSQRPNMKSLKSLIAKILKIREEGNFAEAVQRRLMKYAENLEVIINKRTQMLLEEKQKTERLLYRMLPVSVAHKLKAGLPVVPEEYDNATVMFSDIVGFTSIAGDSSPMQVVDFLNDLYSKLDALIEQFDAYKVETIGDAYMVVSGVPVRNKNNHAAIIADMSLSVRETAERFTIKHLPSKVLQIRCGFHTGPCCAGVVGHIMPKYCLFGDTVNIASRMESYGEGQRIHISHQAYSALAQFGCYRCEFRGELDIKGKGKMKTYWLLGKDEEPTTSRMDQDPKQVLSCVDLTE